MGQQRAETHSPKLNYHEGFQMKAIQTLPKPAALAELEEAAPEALWNIDEEEDDENEDEDEVYTAP